MKNGRSESPGIAPSKENVRQDFLHVLQQLREKVNANPNDTSGVIELARMLFDSHQFKEASTLFERYLKRDVKNTAVMLDLSVCYFNLGQMEDALRVTRSILKTDPENTTGWYNLGAIHATKGEKEEARAAWESLVKKYPGSQDAIRAKESLANLK